ncbi:hypothetical protein EB796_007539 [Bugula neritina]|uniref:Uncharacterized protein n=1 Tax=Bugula neritina TaxID=10212 RepID=A0A7J7K9D3_BUGNE|nr:hypothetical protein EB796_007539 [Bugula neritina]
MFISFLTTSLLAFQFAVKCHIVWSLSEPEESFWESYFSKGSTHQLSGAQDHPISTLSGTIASPYYPANFTLSPATNPGFTITIKTLGYRNIAIFYKTIESVKVCSK